MTLGQPGIPGRRADDPALIVTSTVVDGRLCDIVVTGNRIAAVEPHDPARELAACTRRVDGSGTAALPGLMNGHTHAAMAILRGYADDLPLDVWLRDRIWPLESRLAPDDVYWATRLGCLEMIRTGTTFFNDMYWHLGAVARAVHDAGMRAIVAGVLIDRGDDPDGRRQRDEALRWMEDVGAYGGRVGFALGPHAIYTVDEATLRWVAEVSAERDVLVHTHLAETESEVADCLRAHGCRPVAYLDRLGLLGPRLLAAHAVHLDDDEIARLGDAGATVLHNPASNLKLASGGPMRYRDLAAAGVNVVLGTDGAASNNNLDLFEEMKFAALVAKHASADPTVLPARDALALATTNAARAFRLAAGVVAPGNLADFALIDLSSPFLFPGHDLAADLVYGGGGRAVVAAVCDGRVLMEHGVVEDEADIRREVSERLASLTR